MYKGQFVLRVADGEIDPVGAAGCRPGRVRGKRKNARLDTPQNGFRLDKSRRSHYNRKPVKTVHTLHDIKVKEWMTMAQD